MYYHLIHLRELEAESIFVIRAVAAQFQNPALLFSGGKDSVLLTHLARKAFYPARIPFPLLHVDTGHNFPETIAFRDRWVAQLGVRLIEASVQEAINRGPTNGSFRIATNSASGTRKTSAPNLGTCSTGANNPANISGCSRFPTGPNWMYGNTWRRKKFRGQFYNFAHSRPCFVREGVLYAASEFVRLRTTKPVFFDPYQDNRTTGSGGTNYFDPSGTSVTNAGGTNGGSGLNNTPGSVTLSFTLVLPVESVLLIVLISRKNAAAAKTC